jgi:hypothetical protein
MAYSPARFNGKVYEGVFMARKPATNPLGFRISADVKAALIRAAADDQRSVSALTQVILRQWLTDKGYLEAPAKRPARRPARMDMERAVRMGAA